jgi:hypothetical protein
MTRHEKTKNPRYPERVSNTLQPTSRSSIPRNVDAHDLYTKRHAHLTRGSHVPGRHEDPRFRPRDCPCSENGDPWSESRFPPFSRKTDSPFTINTYLHSSIPLTEIIVIETFIQIIQKIDQSIGVKPTDTPSKHFFWAYYFAVKDSINSPEARVTKPEIILTHTLVIL